MLVAAERVGHVPMVGLLALHVRASLDIAVGVLAAVASAALVHEDAADVPAVCRLVRRALAICAKTSRPNGVAAAAPPASNASVIALMTSNAGSVLDEKKARPSDLSVLKSQVAGGVFPNDAALGADLGAVVSRSPTQAARSKPTAAGTRATGKRRMEPSGR